MKSIQSGTRRAGRHGGHGFTLIELLIVITLTTLLLGLLFGPMLSSFNLTRKTRALTQAQDAARFGIERLSRELSEASYVFDNSQTPVILPLEDPNDLGNNGFNLRRNRYKIVYPTNPTTGTEDLTPPILGAKVDFLPAATFGKTKGSVRDASKMPIIDPTTNGPVGGSALRFPLAPGTRMVRYFVGLSRNVFVQPNGKANKVYYKNNFEFPFTDNGGLETGGIFNPFTLYRAEFSPSDPNLFDQTRFSSGNRDEGGLNDPDFFYNTNIATTNGRDEDGKAVTGNGKTYAENWRDVATPVLTSFNADLLVWRRDENRNYVKGNPVASTVNLSASTVLGDTATPGFLTNGNDEAPGAVPSLYTAKYGAWALPYTLTFYRSATQGSVTASPGGTLTLSVQQIDEGGNIGLRPHLVIVGSSGSLAVDPTGADTYYLFGSNGKLFVKTPALTFQVDQIRGRVETGLPPLAGDQFGVPVMQVVGQTTTTPMLSLKTSTAYADHSNADLVPTVFRLSTRDPQAGAFKLDANGNQILDTNKKPIPVPTNQGIIQADLFQQNNKQNNYYPTTTLTQSLDKVTVTPFVSPYATFAYNISATVPNGLMVVPGSERVVAPDRTLTYNLVTYFRVSEVTSLIASDPGVLQTGPDGKPLTDPVTNKPIYAYTAHTNERLQYAFDTDLPPYNSAILKFDREGDNVIGLPATDLNDVTSPLREVQVTYLWQNNYARNANGEPIDSQRQSVTDSANSPGGVRAIRPEADVVKLDYSTRVLMNIALGARVYDTSSGQPETIQVADKVTIRNIGR